MVWIKYLWNISIHTCKYIFTHHITSQERRIVYNRYINLTYMYPVFKDIHIGVKSYEYIYSIDTFSYNKGYVQQFLVIDMPRVEGCCWRLLYTKLNLPSSTLSRNCVVIKYVWKTLTLKTHLQWMSIPIH